MNKVRVALVEDYQLTPAPSAKRSVPNLLLQIPLQASYQAIVDRIVKLWQHHL